MPNTFFIGDHMRMFPHLQERIIMADPENMNGHVQDNVAVINAVNPEQIKSVASLVQVTMEGKFSYILSKGVLVKSMIYCGCEALLNLVSRASAIPVRIFLLNFDSFFRKIKNVNLNFFLFVSFS